MFVTLSLLSILNSHERGNVTKNNWLENKKPFSKILKLFQWFSFLYFMLLDAGIFELFYGLMLTCPADFFKMVGCYKSVSFIYIWREIFASPTGQRLKPNEANMAGIEALRLASAPYAVFTWHINNRCSTRQMFKYCIINGQECFIPDKTRTARVYCFKNEPFRKFIDVNILKIDLVWAVKSRKKFIENGKRSLPHIKTLVKHVFLLFYLRELLMSLWIKFNEIFCMQDENE